MRSAYDFGVTRAPYACLLFVVGCASPMATLREDNRQLTQTVSELRTARRAQDRKLRDLQHQLDEARANGAGVPTLPVEVVGPSGGAPVAVAASVSPGPAPASGNERVVGVARCGCC
jgi:hypothetical protein